jgi:hypothetical protein
MKTRQGFVSNSSSTSFAVYGYDLEVDEFVDKFGPLVEKEAFDKKNYRDDNDGVNELVYSVQKIFDKSWEIIHSWEQEEVIIGRTLISIKDTETGKEFKDSVKKKLKELNIDLGKPEYQIGEVST